MSIPQTNLVGWYKADDLSLNDNDAVSAWSDLSTAANDLAQSNSSLQPIYKTNIINGKPVVRFANAEYIDQTSTPGIAGTGGFEYFIIIANMSGNQSGSLVGGSGAYIVDRVPANMQLCGLTYVTSTTIGFQKRDDAGNGLGGVESTASLETVNLVSCRRDRGTGFYIKINGTEDSVADSDGDLTPDTFRLGARSAPDSTNFFTGDIAEFILYSTDLSASDRKQVEDYLTSKYFVASTPALIVGL